MNENSKPAAIINHVALVMDASYSMTNLSKAVVKVADQLIADLAKLSKDMDQETRVTVYTFADDVECVIYDKDVLRLPSIAEFYRADGNTALLRATSDAIDDLKLTATKYGDHSFLLYVITDGEENVSDGGWASKFRLAPGQSSFRVTLPRKIAELADNWTLACLVPSAQHVFHTKKFGFPANNIAVWDATSERGMEEAGRTITAATSAYMTSRATGVRGTKSLFTPATGQVDAQAVKAAGLSALDPSSYVLVPVIKEEQIGEFVKSCSSQYQIGKAYYQLTGSPKPKGKRGIIVQGNKRVAVMEKATSKVYVGPEARKLVGLPDHDLMVDPTNTGGDYLLFVQSTSLNRKLYPGTKLLLLTN